MKIRNRKYKLMAGIRKSFGLSLLAFYSFSVIQYTLQTGHQHSHEFTECKINSSVRESDPCHRKLVHHDFQNGCKHATHFSIPIKHCSLCDLILHFDHFIVEANLFILSPIQGTSEIKFIQFNLTGCNTYSQSRAPPAIS